MEIPIKKIEIVDKLSSASYRSVEEIFKNEYCYISLHWSDERQSGVGLNKSFTETCFNSESLNIIQYGDGHKFGLITFNSIHKNKESRLAYSFLEVKSRIITKDEYSLLIEKSKLGISLPTANTKFISADVYGVFCKDVILEEMEDYPYTKTLISNDSDCLIRLNTNEDNFLFILAKEKSLFSGYNEISFQNYITDSIKIMGEHIGYRYKYSIK